MTDDHQAAEQLGVADRERPGNDPAPVVTDQHERAAAVELLGEGPDVLDQGRDPIALERGRSLGQIVAAEIGRHGQVVAAELLELILPGIPELREAVQHEDQLARPAPGQIEPKAVGGDELVADGVGGRGGRGQVGHPVPVRIRGSRKVTSGRRCRAGPGWAGANTTILYHTT